MGTEIEKKQKWWLGRVPLGLVLAFGALSWAHAAFLATAGLLLPGFIVFSFLFLLVFAGMSLIRSVQRLSEINKKITELENEGKNKTQEDIEKLKETTRGLPLTIAGLILDSIGCLGALLHTFPALFGPFLGAAFPWIGLIGPLMFAIGTAFAVGVAIAKGDIRAAIFNGVLCFSITTTLLMPALATAAVSLGLPVSFPLTLAFLTNPFVGFVLLALCAIFCAVKYFKPEVFQTPVVPSSKGGDISVQNINPNPAENPYPPQNPQNQNPQNQNLQNQNPQDRNLGSDKEYLKKRF